MSKKQIERRAPVEPKKRGRPPRNDDIERVTISVNKGVMTELRGFCEKTCQTITGTIEKAIKEYLDIQSK